MAKRKYRWGDGKGKVHSISKEQHRKNVRKQRRQRANDPAKLTAPRGPVDVRRDANQAVGLRYGEQDRLLAQRQQTVPTWFEAYRAQVAGINQGIQQGYQKAMTDVAARAEQAQTADTKSRDSLAASMQKDAASRGATVDPNLFKADVDAANVRRTNADSFGNLLTSQGAAQNTYFGGMQTAASTAQLAEQQRTDQMLRDQATAKGQYRSEYVNQARDDERKYGLEREAFGLDVAQELNDQRNARADRRQKRVKDRRDRRAKGREVNKFGYTNKEWQSFTPAKRQKIQKELGPSGTGRTPKSDGLTPTQRRKQREKKSKANERIQDVIGRWELYKDTKYDFGTDDKPNVRKPTPSELKQKLIKEGFSTTEIHKALVRRKKRMDKRKPKRPSKKPSLNPFD